MNRLITLLFEVSGAVVFWAEIISTLLGMIITIYTSWQIGKFFTGGNDVKQLPSHTIR